MADKDRKQLLMIVPKNIHTKFKTRASSKNTTMTALFVDWVEKQ